MRRLTLSATLLLWINLVLGQTFMADPEAVLTKELQFNLANECYIYFTNPSGDTLHLRWRMIESNLPDSWVADLCDYGTCYSGIPSNGLMSPVYDTIQPYLKLIVQPGENAGACWIWFRAYENGNQTNYADVFLTCILKVPFRLKTFSQQIPFKLFPILPLKYYNWKVRPGIIARPGSSTCPEAFTGQEPSMGPIPSKYR